MQALASVMIVSGMNKHHITATELICRKQGSIDGCAMVRPDSTSGDVSFNITAFDLAGNNLTTRPDPVELIKRHYRYASPMLENLTIYSNNANVSLATINNILNITITVMRYSMMQTLQSWALHT